MALPSPLGSCYWLAAATPALAHAECNCRRDRVEGRIPLWLVPASLCFSHPEAYAPFWLVKGALLPGAPEFPGFNRLNKCYLPHQQAKCKVGLRALSAWPQGSEGGSWSWQLQLPCPGIRSLSEDPWLTCSESKQVLDSLPHPGHLLRN